MLINKKKLVAALLALGFFFISFNIVNKVMQPYKSYEYIIETLAENYLFDINVEDLHNNALKNLLRSLDPFSKYYNKAETEDRRNTWAGILNYGIGVNVLYRNDYTYISTVNQNSPAAAADVRRGDKILAINDEAIYRAFNKDVNKKLKGEANTNVKLLLERSNEDNPIEKTISRSAVPNVAIPYSKLLPNGNGYIKLKHFYGNADDTLKQLILNWKNSEQAFKGLILDLRDNTGGGVKQAVGVASLFLPRQSIIYHQKKRGKDFETVKSNQSPILSSLPLVVLIDENTMSASELVAGALQDYDRAVIIGENSYGKGLVQQTWYNGDSTSMYFTFSKYYTPLKRCIQKNDYEDYYLRSDKEKKDTPIYSSHKKQWFTTGNGRKFFDYNGIIPDVELDKTSKNDFVKSIFRSYALFDFANNYRNKNSKIPNLETFDLDDVTYKNFIEFVQQPEYNIKLPILEEVNNIEKFLKESVQDEKLTTHFEQFKQKLDEATLNICNKNKNDIMALLGESILSRYYNDMGRLAYQFKNDDWAKAAFDILNDKEQYEKILAI